MLKMIILATRKAGFTHPEFRHYVTTVHCELVKSISEVAADIRRYHYNLPIHHVLDEAFRHPRIYLDIITHGWFDSLEAQLKNMQHPRYLSIVRPDEARFADKKNGEVMHYAHEVEIMPGAATQTKIYYFRKRHPSLTRAEFQSAWQQRFPAIVQSIPTYAQVVSRYIQNHTLSETVHRDGFSSQYYDVIDEFSLTDPAALSLLRQDESVLDQIRELERELLDTASTRALATELIVGIP